MSTPKKAIKKFIYKIKLKVLKTHLSFAFFTPPTLFEIDFFEETFLEPINLTLGETQIPSGRKAKEIHKWLICDPKKSTIINLLVLKSLSLQSLKCKPLPKESVLTKQTLQKYFLDPIFLFKKYVAIKTKTKQRKSLN